MNIFIIDDDPLARMIAIELLTEPHYQMSEFDSASSALAAMDAATPDLILLDIEMPGMDGVATCRALREAGHERAHVIFISSHDDLDTRLAAYDAGGSDFVAKPFDGPELLRKVHAVELAIQQRAALANQASFAQTTAFTAMSSLGELGIVLDFMRASFACQDSAQLGRALLSAVEQYGLQAVMEFRLSSGSDYYSRQGGCNPLERSILQHAAGMERIFQFSNRLAINYPNITFLVLTLPLDDPDRVGRLRDHLASLVEGAQVRLKELENEQRRLRQASGIVHTVSELGQALADIETSQANSRMQSLEINRQFQDDLNRAYVHLGLTDAQEAALNDLVERSQQQLDALRADDLTINERLRTTINRVSQLTG